MRIRLAMVLVALTVAASASAASYYCDSHVQGLTTERGGLVIISSFAGSTALQLCSMHVAINGVSTDECKTVYATLLAAQLAGRQIRLWFNDSLTCATQPAWANATGWYHGPVLLD